MWRLGPGAADCNCDSDGNERSRNPGEMQILSLIRKSDLAAIGHGLELPAFFPRFLLVPWDHGSAMIVRIGDEGGFLLR